MNWDDVRIFLAIQRAGTLRGAAQELVIDQTTVSRRLTGLERALGSRLFLRTTGGLALTDIGQNVLTWPRTWNAWRSPSSAAAKAPMRAWPVRCV